MHQISNLSSIPSQEQTCPRHLTLILKVSIAQLLQFQSRRLRLQGSLQVLWQLCLERQAGFLRMQSSCPGRRLHSED